MLDVAWYASTWTTTSTSGSERCFIKLGHECWPSTAGLAASADNDTVAVYADDRAAVLITHDREFTRRRMKNTIGRHVRLDCEQPDARAVIDAHLDELVTELERAHDVVIVVSAAEVTRRAGQCGSTAPSARVCAPENPETSRSICLIPVPKLISIVRRPMPVAASPCYLIQML
jgi:hypothetical protein